MCNTYLVRLEADKITLRPFRLSDAEKIFCSWASDEDTMKLLGCKPYKSIEETRSKLQHKITRSMEGNCPRWCIESENENCAGYIAFFVIDNSAGLITYCVSPKYRNRGIASEAVHIIVDYAFRVCGFEKILASCYINNFASIGVLKKVGFEIDKKVFVSKEKRYVLYKENYICPVGYSIKYY